LAEGGGDGGGDLLRADGVDPGEAIFDPNALITGADQGTDGRTGP
jgi:hypothetical protein